MSGKNGVSVIAKDVLGDVQAEAETSILAAEREAKAILKAAKEQADQTYKLIVTQAKTKIEAEKRKIASVTEVEMRNRLLQTKEDLVDAVFEKVLIELRNFVETEAYHDYLLKNIQSAAERIGQKKLVVQISTKD